MVASLGACVIDNSRLMQECSSLTPDWFGEIRLFLSKKSNSSLKISLSKIFPDVGGNETGR